jgi:hypothetical protein
VRPGSQPADTDIKTYDIGNLNVCTSGQANTTAFGELHVRYKCILKEQVLESTIVLPGSAVHFSSIASTTADNFAMAVQQAGGTPALTCITAALNVITFPAGIPGNYFVAMGVFGTTSASTFSIGNTTGGTALNLFSTSGGRDMNSSMTSALGGADVFTMFNHTVTIASTGATLTVTPSTIVGTGSTELFIFTLPPSVLTLLSPIELRLLELEEKFRALSVFCGDELEEKKSSSPTFVDDNKSVKIRMVDDYPTDLSASYLARVGDALGVRRSGSAKKE